MRVVMYAKKYRQIHDLTLTAALKPVLLHVLSTNYGRLLASEKSEYSSAANSFPRRSARQNSYPRI